MREVIENLKMEKMHLLIIILLAALVMLTVVFVIFCMMWVKAFKHKIVYIIYDRVCIYVYEVLIFGRAWCCFAALMCRCVVSDSMSQQVLRSEKWCSFIPTNHQTSFSDCPDHDFWISKVIMKFSLQKSHISRYFIIEFQISVHAEIWAVLFPFKLL